MSSRKQPTRTKRAACTRCLRNERISIDGSRPCAKGNSNQFELLDTEDDDIYDNTVGSTSGINATAATSTRGRPLKRTQPYDTKSPPQKRSVPAKAKATKTAIETNEDPLLRIEALLKRVEERAERAEKRVESLEEFIRNELFPRAFYSTTNHFGILKQMFLFYLS